MARDDLSDLLVFLEVARHRSFTKAAKKLGLSQSTLSYAVQRLETSLGVRLLSRTTRSVSPTVAGEQLMTSAGPRLEEVQAEMSALAELSDKPAGTIRITTSDHAAKTILIPKLAPLLRAYRDIKVDIVVDYGLTDIAAERYDAGIRLGEQLARGMIAVPIGPPIRLVAVATPSYFAHHPPPNRGCVLLALALTACASSASKAPATAPVETTGDIAITRRDTQATTTAPEQNFTGTARVQRLFLPSAPSKMQGAYVTFEPGARTAWHSHPVGQILVVTAGAGRIQQWGGAVQELAEGDVVWTPPNVKHWHGATPSTSLTHMALVEQLDGKSATWMEKVTDAQYSGE